MQSISLTHHRFVIYIRRPAIIAAFINLIDTQKNAISAKLYNKQKTFSSSLNSTLKMGAAVGHTAVERVLCTNRYKI